ncbi:MAG: hypothetical protein ACSHXF_02560 [Aquaticitalea sp.]
MKRLRSLSILALILLFFSGCSTAQKLQEKAPVELKEVYFQTWIAGVKGGGSGMDLFIPLSSELSESIQLDSVYFRGKVAPLEKTLGDNKLYVGRFRTNLNTKPIVMSSEVVEEHANQVPKINQKLPFELKDSECVVNYRDQNEKKYFKIENVIEKPAQQYPGAPDKQ